jgi:hypothetical protein
VLRFVLWQCCVQKLRHTLHTVCGTHTHTAAVFTSSLCSATHEHQLPFFGGCLAQSHCSVAIAHTYTHSMQRAVSAELSQDVWDIMCRHQCTKYPTCCSQHGTGDGVLLVSAMIAVTACVDIISYICCQLVNLTSGFCGNESMFGINWCNTKKRSTHDTKRRAHTCSGFF